MVGGRERVEHLAHGPAQHRMAPVGRDLAERRKNEDPARACAGAAGSARPACASPPLRGGDRATSGTRLDQAERDHRGRSGRGPSCGPPSGRCVAVRKLPPRRAAGPAVPLPCPASRATGRRSRRADPRLRDKPVCATDGYGKGSWHSAFSSMSMAAVTFSCGVARPIGRFAPRGDKRLFLTRPAFLVYLHLCHNPLFFRPSRLRLPGLTP